MRGSLHHYRRYHRPVRGPFGPALLVIGAVLIGVTVLAGIALVVLVMATVATVAIVSTRRRSRRLVAAQHDPMVAGAHPPGPVPLQRLWHQPPPTQPQPAQDWAATRARFAQLRSEYGQFECDPLAVLRLPALTDVTVASTGRFVDAFAEAQALDTDAEPPAAHCARFATAVEQAWRAWHAARDAAERIRLSNIPAQERAIVQRAIKLLTMARDSGHDAERTAAYSRARAELAKLDRSGTVRLPPAAAAALATAARGQLPPAPAVS